MSSLRLTFSDVYNEVSRIVGWGSTPTGANLVSAKALVHAGYRRFLYPIDMTTGRRHVWSFLRKDTVLDTTSGVWRYTLPEDFNNLIVGFRHGEDSGYPALIKVSPDYILRQRTRGDSSSYPIRFALQPVRYDASMEQLWEVWFHEVPNAVYPLNYLYELRPPELSNATDYFVGGDLASEAILQCALAVAELRYDDKIDIHAQEAERLVQQLIQADTVVRPDIYGVLGGGMISNGRFMPSIIDTDPGLYPGTNPNL